MAWEAFVVTTVGCIEIMRDGKHIDVSWEEQ